MKSFILKDCYNIGHNTKSMVFMLIFMGVILIPTNGIAGFIVLSTVLCGMMLITTFSFDETSKWTRYAMIMPVTKKELVLSKYLLLLIFTIIGVLIGSSVGIVYSIIMHQMNLMVIVTAVLAAFATGIIMGSISVPLLFQFGAEKARIFSILSFSIPALLFIAVIKIVNILEIEIPQDIVKLLLYLSPVFLLMMLYLSYRISCRIFAGKEL